MSSAYRLVDALDWRSGDRGGASWRAWGAEIGGRRVGGGRPETVPPVLIVEALAQCAGLLLHDDARAGVWLLAGIDEARFAPLGWGVSVTVECAVTGRTGAVATVDGSAVAGGVTVCDARLLLVWTALPSTA